MKKQLLLIMITISMWCSSQDMDSIQWSTDTISCIAPDYTNSYVMMRTYIEIPRTYCFDDTCVVYTELKPIDIMQRKETFLISGIIELYKEYSDSCYADSNFIKLNTLCLDSVTINYDLKLVKQSFRHVIKEDECWYLGNWVYKTPTFEGFIKFIEGKLNN